MDDVEPQSREEMAKVIIEEIAKDGGVDEIIIDIAWSHLQLLWEVRELAEHLTYLGGLP